MSVREQFEAWAKNNNAGCYFRRNPEGDYQVTRLNRLWHEWQAAYRAGMERAAGVVEDRMRGMYARMIRAELSALDADCGDSEASKSGDIGPSGARVADGSERVEKTPQIADEFLDQPEPVKNDHPAVWDLVIEDMRRRDHVGLQRYGTRLQPHNGRDALKDAYAEILDLAVYLRQEICEREGN